MGSGYRASRPIPRGSLPPVGSHLLKVPQLPPQCHRLGIKSSNVCLGRTFPIWTTALLYLGAIFFSLFKEPPYFTAEPESRILGEVEETVDIPCRAMGEYGSTRWGFPGGGCL